ncbi:hypothetical protein MASR1M74_20820 [Lentimicrobium sp.]
MLNELDKELSGKGFVMFAMPTTLASMPKVIMLPVRQVTKPFFSKEQAEITHQPGEKRHTQTGELYYIGVRIRPHLCEG